MIISIVVPVYNAGNTLRRCIQSVIDQDCQDYELILVDNNSKDESLNICKQYSDKYKRIFTYSCPVQGVSAARNLGILKSTGAYLFFLDSDDYIGKGFLKTAVFHLKDSIYDWVIPSVVWVTGGKQRNGIPDKSDIVLNSHKELCKSFYELLPYYTYYIVFKIYKAEIIRKNKIKFDVQCSLGEDLCFNLEYITYVNRALISKDMQYFLTLDQEGSLNYKFREDMFTLKQSILKAVRLFIEKNRLAEADNYKKYYYVYLNECYACMVNIYKDPDYKRRRAKKQIKELFSYEDTRVLLKYRFGGSLPCRKGLFLLLMKTKSFLLIHFAMKILKKEWMP